MHTPNHSEKGIILLFAMILMSIMILMMGVLFTAVSSHIVAHRGAVYKEQALGIAEAGAELAIWKLNNQSEYSGETGTEFGNGTYDVSITTVDSSKKTITVTSYIPDSTNPKSTRTVKLAANIGTSAISFRYGLQAGAGGFSMGGGSILNGNIYANGDINAISATITGSAVAANPPASYADQTNDTPAISSCTGSNCINFGNATATEDFAQSFKISTAVELNSIQFYIKKTSTPSNASVKIVTDNAGSPSSTVLMSGTLTASTVTSSFGWVSVAMPSTPILDPSQTYWIVIDASSNSTRYYTIGANSAGYANGTGKIGRQSAGTWSNTTPSGLDGYFKIYLGGGTSMIGGAGYAGGVNIGTNSSDTAWAHTVAGASVTGTIYCQTGTNNNKTCDTSRSDPTPETMPLSDSNIQEWKDDAEAGGVITGNYSVGWAGASLGPKKIVGNLTVGGGGTLTVTGTLWVTGTITVSGGGIIRLSSTYGTNSGAIVSDSYVSLTGGANFAGSGQAGSYPFLITTSACPVAAGCNSNDAIVLSGGAGTVALIAQNGNATINGGSSLKQVTAKQITMGGGATLTYDSGLISENFSSGPGGAWEFTPGTYQITR